MCNWEPPLAWWCWTDSIVTHGWIKSSPSRWKPWVANRVTVIQCHWSYEMGTWCRRGKSCRCSDERNFIKELVDSSLWWKGPVCLMQNVKEAFEVEFSEDGPLVRGKMKGFLWFVLVLLQWCVEFERVKLERGLQDHSLCIKVRQPNSKISNCSIRENN